MNIQSAHVPFHCSSNQTACEVNGGDLLAVHILDPKGFSTYRITWMVKLHKRSAHSLAKVEFSNRIDNNNTNYRLSFLAAPLALF